MIKHPYDIEQWTFPFRYLTGPLLVVLQLSAWLFFYCYTNDQKYYRETITRIEKQQEAIVARIDLVKDRTEDQLAYLHQFCCAETTVPPPVATRRNN